MTVIIIIIALVLVINYPWILLLATIALLLFLVFGFVSKRNDDKKKKQAELSEVRRVQRAYAKIKASPQNPNDDYPYTDYRTKHAHTDSLERASKIVSVFTQKWYDIACESFVVVDIETTGLNKECDHIIELAALRYEGGVEQEKFTTLVKPPISIPYDSTVIHNITNAMVQNAPFISSVIPAFLDFVGESLLVGHNANFDISFIEIAAREAGFDPKWNYIDTISVAKRTHPGLINYKQQTVLRALNYSQPSAHRAEDDARGCAQILVNALICLAKGESLPALTPPPEKRADHDVEAAQFPFLTKYDLPEIQSAGYGRYEACHALSGSDKDKAIEDIAMVCKAASLRVDVQDLVFYASSTEAIENDDFTHLTICKKTASGRVPSYPLRLYFTTSDDPNRLKSYYTGEIFYLKNGNVGKYVLNRWKRLNRFEFDRAVYRGKIG